MLQATASFVLCPNCTSAFSVTDQQLEAALGAVRCGSCKKIFNAKYNLVTAKELNAFALTATSANLALEEEPAKEQTPTQTQQEEALQSEDAIEVETLDLSQSDLTPEEEAKFEEVENQLGDWLDLTEDELELSSNTEITPPITTKEPNFAAENLPTEDLTSSLDDDFFTELIPESASELPKTSEVNTMAKKTNSKLLVILLTLALALTAGVGGTLWFLNSGNQGDFKISQISVNPTASQLQLRVEFKLTNTSNETKIIPTLEVHLLNLSSKTITKHLANAASLGAPNSSLPAGKSYDLSLTVERPYTLVKSAKVLIYQAN